MRIITSSNNYSYKHSALKKWETQDILFVNEVFLSSLGRVSLNPEWITLLQNDYNGNIQKAMTKGKIFCDFLEGFLE